MNVSGVVNVVVRVALFFVDVVCLFKLYGKLGEKQWISIIPFFNEYTMFKKVYSTRAFWTYTICDLIGAILMSVESTAISMLGVIPAIAVIVFQVRYAKNFAAAFGKGRAFAVLTFLFPAVVYLYCGYSANVEYVGNRS